MTEIEEKMLRHIQIVLDKTNKCIEHNCSQRSIDYWQNRFSTECDFVQCVTGKLLTVDDNNIVKFVD